MRQNGHPAFLESTALLEEGVILALVTITFQHLVLSYRVGGGKVMALECVVDLGMQFYSFGNANRTYRSGVYC